MNFLALFAQTAYLCIVFFMVLDLRLTKVGVQRHLFFLPFSFLTYSHSRLLTP